MVVDRLFSVYVSVSPSPGEPRVEALLSGLLKLGIIPLWPERRSSWEERKALLNESDYLMLFSGHSYVARPPSGVSWQHRELNHAFVQQIPVFSAFLDEGSLADQVQDGFFARMQAFRKQVADRPDMTWHERRAIPEELKKAWPAFILKYPATGWSRQEKPDSSLPLRKIVGTVKVDSPVEPIETRNEACQTGEAVDLNKTQWMQEREAFSYICKVYIGGNCTPAEQSGSLQWVDVCDAFLNPLSPSASEDRIHRSLAELLSERFTQTVLAAHDQSHAATDFRFSETSMRKIRLKLRRSGLIRKDTKASGRHYQVWVKTPEGQRALTRSMPDAVEAGNVPG